MCRNAYCACSVMSDSATPWSVACQAPPSVEFSRQEYWCGLPFPISVEMHISVLFIYIIIAIFMELFLRGRHCTELFESINSFNSHKDPMNRNSLSLHFTHEETKA